MEESNFGVRTFAGEQALEVAVSARLRFIMGVHGVNEAYEGVRHLVDKGWSIVETTVIPIHGTSMQIDVLLKENEVEAFRNLMMQISQDKGVLVVEHGEEGYEAIHIGFCYAVVFFLIDTSVYSLQDRELQPFLNRGFSVVDRAGFNFCGAHWGAILMGRSVTK
jgi:hypothetical protein